ncbi:epidermal growth factor receptor kinase substrate 8-like protein 1 isoform X2 [Siniperca chuatsi]|uniref:epidermal growth factor receptor kinase substrate 8-like protein 1 isoform X2 n=1 Tax=Siniperca chuatsi TaxID=119488 RepID=UPI001CE2247B|nr:epidermal growth factor receptor kinase substrate 8-like protein 1 isoform X2 [Siniperca chuatsi]
MTNISRYLVNHLLTFSLQDGDVQGVEEAQSRLSFLAQNKKLWSQQMYLDVGAEAIHLRDIQSQDELENYSFKSIFRCDAINTEKHFPSLLLLVCQGVDQKKPDIHFFNCETVKAEQICDDIARTVSGSSTSRSKKLPDALRLPQSGGEMIDPYEIPSPPIPHAPNPPPSNPPPYPGLRANGVNSGPDISFLRAEREVGILNHCFDDIENFMAKLQQTAEAATVLSQRKKKKKRSKKQSAEDLLTAKARPPPEEEFIDIFQKFKYCFSLLARLKSTISNPSSEELVHHVFKPLDMMVKTTGGPGLGASVSSPALTNSAVSLLQDNLNEEERQLWTSLGHNWTLPRSQLKGPVAPYTPVFLDGWKPEALRADGQVWEDPVESQYNHEDLRVKQEPPQPVRRPDSRVSDEIDRSTFQPEPERVYSCTYDFIARNSSELSVQQGETLEVIESSKRWWKCRNRFNQIGFVPFNILEPMAHVDSPVTNKPPSAPAPPPLAKTFSAVPPSPLAPPQAPSHSPKRPHSLPAYSQHIPAAEDTDNKVMLMNDELLQRLTNGKNLNKPLVIPRSSETSVPLDYHSPPEEVAEWLRGKGFSEPTVSCLGVLTGAQLFSLNKEELRAVIPDEGTRVYSQLSVQKALLEDARRATELEAVMEKQKMKVDLKLESSTL